MEPISNADRLALLLRQKLEERAKASGGGRVAGKARTDANAMAPIMDVRALAAIEWSDEKPLRRGIIENLLVEQFGPELINDAQFQQIVSRVTETIENDEETAGLLSRAISDLRQP